MKFNVLLISAFFGLSTGLGFGAALRSSGFKPPGAQIIQREQSFPPRDEWPVQSNN